jgi:hypothetical protein
LGAEDVAEAQLKKDYAGTYTFHPAGGIELNSSMTLTQTTPRALHISSLVSNSRDVLAALGPLIGQKSVVSSGIYFALQPTFLSRTSADGEVGEVWWFINVIDDYYVLLIRLLFGMIIALLMLTLSLMPMSRLMKLSPGESRVMPRLRRWNSWLLMLV